MSHAVGVKKRPEDEDATPRPNLLRFVEGGAASKATTENSEVKKQTAPTPPIQPEKNFDPNSAQTISLGDDDSIKITSNKSWGIIGGAEANIIGTWGGNDTVSGGDGADSIDAGNGNNIVDAGADNDTVSSGDGNDVVKLGSGADMAWSLGGNDSIDGGSGNDYIVGGNKVGELSYYIGGTGNDQLSFNGAGKAKMDGSNGKDWLGISGTAVATGGEGADTFNFSNNGKISSEITDFAPGDGDVINLQSLGTWSYDAVTGAVSFDAIGLEEISLTAGGDLDLGEYGSIQLPLLGISDPSELVNTGALVLGSDWSYYSDGNGKG